MDRAAVASGDRAVATEPDPVRLRTYRADIVRAAKARHNDVQTTGTGFGKRLPRQSWDKDYPSTVGRRLPMSCVYASTAVAARALSQAFVGHTPQNQLDFAALTTFLGIDWEIHPAGRTHEEDVMLLSY